MIPSDNELSLRMISLALKKLNGAKYYCDDDGCATDECYTDVLEAVGWACDQMEVEYPELVEANTNDTYWYDDLRDDVVEEVCWDVMEPRYECSIVDWNVELPEELTKIFTEDDFDEMYDKLSEFVHSFDGKMQVDGRIINLLDGEDVEYTSSIMD